MKSGVKIFAAPATIKSLNTSRILLAICYFVQILNLGSGQTLLGSQQKPLLRSVASAATIDRIKRKQDEAQVSKCAQVSSTAGRGEGKIQPSSHLKGGLNLTCNNV